MISRDSSLDRIEAISKLDTLWDEATKARASGLPLPSPCVNICRIDDGLGWCGGCLRQLEEIAGWRSMNEDAKWAIWIRIQQRRTTY